MCGRALFECVHVYGVHVSVLCCTYFLNYFGCFCVVLDVCVDLEVDRERTEALLALRRDQFQLLMHSLLDFQRTIDEEGV